MRDNDQYESDQYELDPVFVHSRREAWVIMGIFLVFGVYSITASFLLGRLPEDGNLSRIRTMFGMPNWVAWGVLLPWLLANIVTAWFCFGFMKNDPLDDEAEDDNVGAEAELKTDGAEVQDA